MHVFSTSLKDKGKLVDKMKQSTYLRVILHAKHKKLPVLAVFFFFFFLISKMSTMFGDVTGLQKLDLP